VFFVWGVREVREVRGRLFASSLNSPNSLISLNSLIKNQKNYTVKILSA
jgi:hypothetical protein